MRASWQRLSILGVVALCGATLVLGAGCVREQARIVVFPDGSGKITLHTELGQQASAMILAFTPESERGTVGESQLDDLYQEFEGIAVWEPGPAGVEEGRIAYTATGYFDDIGQVRRTSDDRGERFERAVDGDMTTISYTLKNTGEEDGEEEEIGTVEELEATQAQMEMAMDAMLADFEMSWEIQAPAAIQEAKGTDSHEGRVARASISVDDIKKMIGEALPVELEIARRIEAGELTQSEGQAEMRKRMSELGLDRGMEMAWSVRFGPADEEALADEIAACRADRERAEKEWGDRAEEESPADEPGADEPDDEE